MCALHQATYGDSAYDMEICDWQAKTAYSCQKRKTEAWGLYTRQLRVYVPLRFITLPHFPSLFPNLESSCRGKLVVTVENLSTSVSRFARGSHNVCRWEATGNISQVF
jgi:hypothetical protein